MKLVFFALMMVFFVNFANTVEGLSVVSDFLENDTLLVSEGSSALYGIRIQNPDDFDSYVKVTFDTQRARIPDYRDTYVVAPKSSLSLRFNISALDTKPGESFKFGYTIHELEGSGEGIPILLKINKNINVRITENPEFFYFRKYHVILGVMILAIAYFFYREYAPKSKDSPSNHLKVLKRRQKRQKQKNK